MALIRFFDFLTRTLGFILLCLSTESLSLLESTGSTVYLDDISYYVHPNEVGAFDVATLGLQGVGLQPATVLSHEDNDTNAITSKIAKMVHDDDVWQPGFLEVIISQFQEGTANQNLRAGPRILTKTLGFMSRNSTLVSHPHAGIANGPYFMDMSSGRVYMGYRLYSDFEGAFTETLIQGKNGEFRVLPANVPGQSLAVGVPSKTHFTKTKRKPLNGVRIGVKDIYDIEGVRTSNGNRAWYHFYPPAKATAPAVQRLIDAGAIIVGKMKTSQFANGEMATADWVDYHSPFNPRGDGYQDPSASSAGPAAGVGAYPWLDIALGSDTGGSIRAPSEVQGLFGNRPSYGMVSLEHVMPLSPLLDTAGFFSRDPDIWAAASDVLYGGLQTNYTFPKKILLLGYPRRSLNNSPAEKNLITFANKLARTLSALTVHYDIYDDFRRHGPSNAPTKDLNDLLSTTYPILISKQQTNLVRDPFYASYAAKYDGRRPFVDPVPLRRWAYGDSFPASAVQEAKRNKTIFADWFNRHVLGPNPKSCSDKLLLYVGSEGDPAYRNAYLGDPGVPIGFSSGRISSFSGAPDFVLPVGQSGYSSTVTKHSEVLPDTVDIMAARNCDGMLFSLIKRLISAGILDESTTGRSLVAGGDILLRKRHMPRP